MDLSLSASFRTVTVTTSPQAAWLEATVSRFPGCRATQPDAHPTIAAVLASIRDPAAPQAALVARVRAAATKDEQTALKAGLPAVTFAADLHHRQGDCPLEERLRAWSGLAALDLDHLDTPEAVRDGLRGDPFVAAAFLSPSGFGVKVLVRFADPARFAECWRAAAGYFRAVHGLTIDPAPKSPTSLCYLSHDPDVWLADGPVDALQPMPGEEAPEPIDPQPSGMSGQLRPGDDYNANADVAALLTQHGWSHERTTSDGNQHWCRPGKTAGTSATLKDRVFYVFSSNAAPFEANRAYSPFAVLALLEFAGDFAAAARGLRQHGFGDQMSEVPPAPVVADDSPEPETPDPGILPAGLLRVPGFISQVMEHTLATAPYPEPTLAFCGALSLLAALAGRKVRDPSDVRTNVYCLALANSGTGKDHPRKVNERIFLEAGLIGSVGDNFASGEGIEDALVAQPTLLFQTDEIDGMLMAVAKSRDGRAERIMEMLLKFYSAANQHYHCRVKAGKERLSIDQPCLVLFGTAVPKHYYEALCEKMLSHGFFARMLVFEAGLRGTGQEAVMRPLPEPLLRTARWWATYQPGRGGNLIGEHPVPAIVPLDDGGTAEVARLRLLGDAAYTKAQASDDAIAMAVWARAVEKARKLALLYALSVNHEHPVITADAVRWGWTVVEHLTRRQLFMAGRHVFDSDFDALCKRMVTILEGQRARHGEAYMEAWKVARRMKLSVRALEEVREALIAQRRVEYLETQTGGTPQRLYRLSSTGRATGTYCPGQQASATA